MRTHHSRGNTPPRPPAVRPQPRFCSTEASQALGKKARGRNKILKRCQELRQQQPGSTRIWHRKEGVLFPCPRVDTPPDLACREALVEGGGRACRGRGRR